MCGPSECFISLLITKRVYRHVRWLGSRDPDDVDVALPADFHSAVPSCRRAGSGDQAAVAAAVADLGLRGSCNLVLSTGEEGLAAQTLRTMMMGGSISTLCVLT
jgi:hypothetical protein